jgi:diadenosine tetraphosphate (Ap4A) HIT family hydrolase
VFLGHHSKLNIIFMPSDCIFCLIHQGELCFISQDKYPASPGHMLIIPNRHVPNYFDCTKEELADLWEKVNIAKQLIEEEHKPDSYNIGINVSECAGQSVPHTHIHLIPRYEGDVADPSGGVRNVIPDKRIYKKSSA